jgi:hypothetical protein
LDGAIEVGNDKPSSSSQTDAFKAELGTQTDADVSCKEHGDEEDEDDSTSQLQDVKDENAAQRQHSSRSVNFTDAMPPHRPPRGAEASPSSASDTETGTASGSAPADGTGPRSHGKEAEHLCVFDIRRCFHVLMHACLLQMHLLSMGFSNLRKDQGMHPSSAP